MQVDVHRGRPVRHRRLDLRRRATPPNWPDIPWDQNCTSTHVLHRHYSPTFFTQKRLATVTTQVWNGPAQPTDRSTSGRCTRRFPDPGDGTRAGLWLDRDHAHRPRTAATPTLPDVNVRPGIQMPNRVDTDTTAWPR